MGGQLPSLRQMLAARSDAAADSRETSVRRHKSSRGWDLIFLIMTQSNTLGTYKDMDFFSRLLFETRGARIGGCQAGLCKTSRSFRHIERPMPNSHGVTPPEDLMQP